MPTPTTPRNIEQLHEQIGELDQERDVVNAALIKEWEKERSRITNKHKAMVGVLDFSVVVNYVADGTDTMKIVLVRAAPKKVCELSKRHSQLSDRIDALRERITMAQSQRNVTRLSPEAWDELQRILDSDAPPSVALLKAAKQFRDDVQAGRLKIERVTP